MEPTFTTLQFHVIKSARACGLTIADIAHAYKQCDIYEHISPLMGGTVDEPHPGELIVTVKSWPYRVVTSATCAAHHDLRSESGPTSASPRPQQQQQQATGQVVLTAQGAAPTKPPPGQVVNGVVMVSASQPYISTRPAVIAPSAATSITTVQPLPARSRPSVAGAAAAAVPVVVVVPPSAPPPCAPRPAIIGAPTPTSWPITVATTAAPETQQSTTADETLSATQLPKSNYTNSSGRKGRAGTVLATSKLWQTIRKHILQCKIKETDLAVSTDVSIRSLKSFTAGNYTDEKTLKKLELWYLGREGQVRMSRLTYSKDQMQIMTQMLKTHPNPSRLEFVSLANECNRRIESIGPEAADPTIASTPVTPNMLKRVFCQLGQKHASMAVSAPGKVLDLTTAQYEDEMPSLVIDDA
jgi:hypothetical protein